MAGDWIKVEHVTPDKPEVHRMAELLGIDPDAVVGKLLRVWIWADQQTTDGHAPSVTRALLDRLTAVTGFADAMAHDTVRWLVRDETGEVSFPHFDRHNGASAKARSQAARRQQNHRDTSRSCHAPTVTSALPEKRREEKSREEEGGGEHPAAPALEVSKDTTVAEALAQLRALRPEYATVSEAAFFNAWKIEPDRERRASAYAEALAALAGKVETDMDPLRLIRGYLRHARESGKCGPDPFDEALKRMRGEAGK